MKAVAQPRGLGDLLWVGGVRQTAHPHNTYNYHNKPTIVCSICNILFEFMFNINYINLYINVRIKLNRTMKLWE